MTAIILQDSSEVRSTTKPTVLTMCRLTETDSSRSSRPSSPMGRKRPGRHVRFNERVIVHNNNNHINNYNINNYNNYNDNNDSQGMSTWLSQTDFFNIQEDIYRTLDNQNTATPMPLHSRGLENYSSERGLEGSLKPSVSKRRKRATFVVLQEQALQRRQWQLHFGTNCSGSANPETIRTIYRHQTYSSTYVAIDLGRLDSMEALAVYQESPPTWCTAPTDNNIGIASTRRPVFPHRRQSEPPPRIAATTPATKSSLPDPTKNLFEQKPTQRWSFSVNSDR